MPAPETAKVNLSSHTISGDEELTQTNSEREVWHLLVELNSFFKDAKNTKTFTTELAAKAKEFKPSGLALPSVLDEPRMDNLRILHRNIERGQLFFYYCNIFFFSRSCYAIGVK